MSKRCDKCVYYEPNNPKANMPPAGGCRRSPPVLSPDEGFIWPIMEADDWCGEFKPGDAEPEPVVIEGIVSGANRDGVICVECWKIAPKRGTYVEMRIVKGPEE